MEHQSLLCDLLSRHATHLFGPQNTLIESISRNDCASYKTLITYNMFKVKESALLKAETLLNAEKYAAAASAVKSAAKLLPDKADCPTLARTALILAKALAAPLMDQLVDEKQEPPPADAPGFTKANELFNLALMLDPENEEAAWHCMNMMSIVTAPQNEEGTDAEEEESNHPEPFDVVIVGGGASGVGMSVMLIKSFGLKPERVLIVERGKDVGESFRQWPKEMQFISPSFNSQGWTDSFDLNSIAHGTSPAHTIFGEHPSGDQYADYLHHVAKANDINVRTETEVMAIRPFKDGDGFEVDVTPAGEPNEAKKETLRSRYVVWAAGEFQYPRAASDVAFEGAEHCLHNSRVHSWSELSGNDFVVIGGYESGMDAAINLSKHNKRCTVISSTAYWNLATDDPSTELAPFTADRVRKACASEVPPKLLAPLRVESVKKLASGEYEVHAKRVKTEDKRDAINDDGEERLGLHRLPLKAIGTPDEDVPDEVTFTTPRKPLLCTGFAGSVKVGVAKDLFAWGEMKEKKDHRHDDEENEEDDGLKGAIEAAVKFKNRTLKRLADKDFDSGEHSLKKAKAEASSQGNGQSNGGCAYDCPLINAFDESTITPGLFLVGPAVRHDDHSFCFVYKFRQRFGIVADAILRGLGYETSDVVKDLREKNMFLDDLSCCQAACGESC